MDNTGDLKLLLASRYPVIFAETPDETRFLDVLRGAAGALHMPIWVWSATRGLARAGMEPQYGTADPQKALDFAADTGQPGVFVFADARAVLDGPVVLRRFKEFAQSDPIGQTVVFTAPRASVPPELAGLSVVWKLRPPSRDELAAMVRGALADLAARSIPVTIPPEDVSSLVDALKGLSMSEARRLVEQAALRDGAVSTEDVAFVREEKAGMLDAGALELVPSEGGSLDDVGGLERLKDWLHLRGRAFEPAAKRFGLEAPRGLLITGVPGCGKSLVAKLLARSWDLPLVLLDVSALYGPYIGESEGRLRDALDAAEAMAPVVVWVDEIEKAFAAPGGGDGGVSKRILGEFLRWMQERPDGVFVVATSNDVSAVPPELLRKGRFDEIFFVDLPAPEERAQIFSIQLTRRKREPQTFDLGVLVESSEGFSGAEIEAAVVGAMYRAYAANHELGTADLIAELHATVPLSRTRAEDIAELRAWARTRAVPAHAEPHPVGAPTPAR